MGNAGLLTVGLVVVMAVVALVLGFVFVLDGFDRSDESTTPDDGQTPGAATYPGVLEAEHNEFAEFEDVATAVGLDYEAVNRFSPFTVVNPGPYVVDFTNDGYEDLLLIGGERPTLFENTGGAFERVQKFDHPDAMTAHFFDYDNSGYEDLILVESTGSVVLYENDGGEFVKQPDAFPNGNLAYPTTVTSADFTGNGCLDVYIGNWVGPSADRPMSIGEFREIGDHHPEVRPTTETGGKNDLYVGDCESFEHVADEAGVDGNEFTLAVSAADFTGNGHVDIHVGNDFSGDFIYENQGDLEFTKIDMGPASDRNAMSSVAVDMTGNHRLDLFVTNVYFENPPHSDDLVPVLQTPLPYGNNLFANEGGGEFTDIAPDHDLHRGSWGWAATVADYTNDGHLDVIHASMYVNPTIVSDQPDIFRPPQVWKGTADSWEKVNGFDVGFSNHNLRGIARIDYQNNGVLDVVGVENPSQSAIPGVERDGNRTMLYENSLDSDESLQLWVKNPNGLDRNAGVYVETDERTIYRETTANGDLLSQDSRLIHVGTGSETVERVIVEWPDGNETIYDDLVEGNRYVLTPEGAEIVD